MKLCVHKINLQAGKPIAFLHERDANLLDVRPGDRIIIKSNGKLLTAIIDVSSNLFKPGYVALSNEIISELNIKSNSFVDIHPTAFSEGSKILQKKIRCANYTKKELTKIMQDIVNGNLSEAEIAYFVSGVYHCGLSTRETIYLIESIVATGKRIKWSSNKIVDKHSIGGIPGNRTTPIVVSICAADGIIMPKTSSRAITSPAGTADVIESIAKVDFSIEEIKKIVNKTGACLVWGGSLGLAPADDKLIQVEKRLNIDPEPQLLASILSKKLAVGSKYVLIDIPYGQGAKVSKKEAKHLKRKFLTLGKKVGLIIKVVLTDGSQPIGNGIGPILEIKDVLRVLKRDNPPRDLESKSIILAGHIFEMLKKAPKGKGKIKAQTILDSGAAFLKFKEIINAQHGRIDEFPKTKYQKLIISKKSGMIRTIKNKGISMLAKLSGCPEDKSSGIYLYKHVGDIIEKNEPLLTIYSESKAKLKDAINFFESESPISIS